MHRCSRLPTNCTYACMVGEIYGECTFHQFTVNHGLKASVFQSWGGCGEIKPRTHRHDPISALPHRGETVVPSMGKYETNQGFRWIVTLYSPFSSFVPMFYERFIDEFSMSIEIEAHQRLSFIRIIVWQKIND